LLIGAALQILALERDDGSLHLLKWKNFPDVFFRDQFLTYLQLTETLQITPGAGANQKQAREAQLTFERLLAHLSVGCAMALHVCVEEGHVLNPHQRQVT
jgi:hypothetical protein